MPTQQIFFNPNNLMGPISQAIIRGKERELNTLLNERQRIREEGRIKAEQDLKRDLLDKQLEFKQKIQDSAQKHQDRLFELDRIKVQNTKERNDKDREQNQAQFDALLPLKTQKGKSNNSIANSLNQVSALGTQLKSLAGIGANFPQHPQHSIYQNVQSQYVNSLNNLSNQSQQGLKPADDNMIKSAIEMFAQQNKRKPIRGRDEDAVEAILNSLGFTTRD